MFEMQFCKGILLAASFREVIKAENQYSIIQQFITMWETD